MTRTPATQSRKYLQFKNELNKALDQLHVKSQQKVTDLLRGIFTRALEIVALRYAALDKDNLVSPQARSALRAIDEGLDQLFQLASKQILDEMTAAARRAYTLSLVGNAEALGRAQGEIAKYSVTKDHALSAVKSGRDGENLASRVMLIFDRLRRKILNAVELGAMNEESPAELLKRVTKALPSKRVIKRPQRELKPITTREADASEKQSFSVGFVTDEEWDEIVDEYLTGYIPRWRGPETVFDLPDTEGGPDLEERYGWELEQEITDSFVRSVRNGDMEAAKQNGIVDFSWIAVVDDRTDECCLWRDGLTSTEIERELKGAHKDDECQVIVPPAHFNCRCDMAPMLKDMPELEPSNLQDFEEWLNS